MVEANNDYDDGQLYGEDLANYIAEMRAKAEAFFAQAGKDPLEIYRIEKFEPVRQAPETHGKFYQGDSYVVLSQKRGNYDIHYWHGKEATAVSRHGRGWLRREMEDCCLLLFALGST